MVAPAVEKGLGRKADSGRSGYEEVVVEEGLGFALGVFGK